MNSRTLSSHQMGKLAYYLRDFIQLVDAANTAGKYIGMSTLGSTFAMSAADVIRAIASVQTYPEREAPGVRTPNESR